MFFLFAAILFTICAQAQDIVITNNSCQDVMVDISADVAPDCKQAAQSVPYKLPQKGVLKLSMTSGGTYPAINWAWGSGASGYQFTLVKVYNSPTAPVALGYMFNPCWGSPNFTNTVPCGTMNGTSAGWSTTLVTADVN